MSWRLGSRATLIAPLFFAVGAALALAEEKEPGKLSPWQKLFRKQAAEYTFVVGGQKQAEVKLVPEPVLNWSQPVRGGAEGAVFVWTQSARPVAIGTLFIWPDADGVRQNVTHELHSLSQEPFTATWRSQTWTPPKDSIVWAALPDAPKPAARREQRLRQMRDAAGRFSAESVRDDRRWGLRLLPQPVYRYSLDKTDGDGDLIDGALFGFVEGTDLEVVLALEARKSGPETQWEYALARMSDLPMTVKLGEQTAWQVERSRVPNPRAAYTCSTVETRTSAEDN